MSEIKSQSLVEAALHGFGGVQALIGNYKMRGFIGAFANTQVEFKVENEVFWVSVNKDKFKQVHLCHDKPGQVAQASQILKLKVLKPKTPQNGLILVRPGSQPDQLLVSAHRSRWKFLKFKKTKSTENLTVSLKDL